MSTIEDQISSTVDEMSQSARKAVRSGEVVAWLCDFSRTAAQSTCVETLAAQGAFGLASALGVSHCAVGTQQRDGLVMDLCRIDGHATRVVNTALSVEHSILTSAWGSKTPHQVGDINSTDPDQALLDCGIRSAAVESWGAGEHVSGIVLLGHHQPRKWRDDELALLDSLAQQLGAVLDRTKVRNELDRQKALLQSLHGTMEAGMIIMSPDGYITDVNAAAGDITGFEPHELIGRSLWSALLISDDLQHVKESFARLQRDASSERFESFVLTKVGERRRISWSVAQLAGDGYGEPAIVCTGVDITERCEALERAVRAESVSANARQMFADLQNRLSNGERQLSESQSAKRLPPGVEFERRARARRAYPYMQLVAPIYGNRPPASNAFKEMKCHDISSRGFSFIMPSKPDFDKLVVAFGTPPTVVYLTAEIRHATLKPGTNPRQYIVGCRYTGRVPPRNRDG